MHWFHRLSPDKESEILASLANSATSSRSYYILTILSTLIATFGLYSNSTATVIGAMIVAPLMGPILGCAMGVVRSDSKMLQEGLQAEGFGVLAALATATLLTILVGPANIDLTGSEIQGRIRPTLFDMGIGLAAGMAGAYATVNTRISASIAGVAIAVALVPPLAVCGVMLAASWHNPELTMSAFRAFMLFLANFLTIEVSAALVFLAAGLGHLPHGTSRRPLARFALGTGLLLLATFVFLSIQLSNLVLERSYQATASQVLESRVPRLVPGAGLDSLTVHLEGSRLRIRGVIRAPQEITPGMVRDLARTLQERLNLPDSTELDLLLGTATLTYLSPAGVEYVQPLTREKGLELNLQVGSALREALGAFSHAELVQWSRPDPSQPGTLFVTVRSPFVFDAALVQELQTVASATLLEKNPMAPGLKLLVRTITTHDFTEAGPLLAPVSEILSARERQMRDREEKLRIRLETLVADQEGALLLGMQVKEATPPAVLEPAQPEDLPTPVFGEPPATLEVQARVQSPQLLPAALVRSWEEALSQELEIPTRLSVNNTLGTLTTAPAAETP